VGSRFGVAGGRALRGRREAGESFAADGLVARAAVKRIERIRRSGVGVGVRGREVWLSSLGDTRG